MAIYILSEWHFYPYIYSLFLSHVGITIYCIGYPTGNGQSRIYLKLLSNKLFKDFNQYC